VLVDGMTATTELWTNEVIKMYSWDKCPGPEMMGTPLCGTKRICESAVTPSNQLATTWLFINPLTGFADLLNYKWMGGPHD